MERLKDEKFQFALAGGLVASLYRKTPRLTVDLDFLIATDASPEEVAKRVIEPFHLKAGFPRRADLDGGPIFARKSRRSAVWMVVGRDPSHDNRIGLDFLLPGFPWFQMAFDRALHHRIDFGFGPLPSLTKEDVMISKFHPFSFDSSRFKDLDDLKEIFADESPVDLRYVLSRMMELSLPMPEPLRPFVPATLLKATRSIRRPPV